MKVAIAGAGISGLSCAYVLKSGGIEPDIKEKKGYIGEVFDYAGLRLKIFENGKDIFKKYLKEYGLDDIKPVSKLKKIQMAGPKRKVTVRGRNLGYVYNRGENEYSVEKQIYKRSDFKIQFKKTVDPLTLNGFDYIIDATGRGTTPKKLNIWTSELNTIIKMANILNPVPIDTAKIWFDKKYTNNCFAFLNPYSDSQSRLCLIVDNATKNDMKYYWEKFLTEEKLEFDTVETREMYYEVGMLQKPQYNNILFTGNAGGFTDNFIGFGMLSGMASGILAAKCILNKLDYGIEAKPMLEYVKKINKFRALINTFGREDYDKLLSFLGTPVIKQLIYNNPFFRAVNLTKIAEKAARKKFKK